jgi:hypothetical protein
MFALADASKRPLSIQSRGSTQSAAQRPVVPPKKKQKLEAHLAQRKNPYANLALALDDTEMNEQPSAEAHQSPTTSPQPITLASKSIMRIRQSPNIHEQRQFQGMVPYSALGLAFSDTDMKDQSSLDLHQSHASLPRNFVQEEVKTSSDLALSNFRSYIPAYGEAGPSTSRAWHPMSSPSPTQTYHSMDVDDPEALTPTPSVYLPGLGNSLSDQNEDDWEDMVSGLSISTNEPLIKEGQNVSQLSLSHRWRSVQEVVGIARQLDPDRRIDTYSEDEITNMKRAADYLYALAFDDDASLLHALLVKRYQARGYRQPSAAFSTIIAYAYAANKKSHFEIVQNLLDTELNNNPSPLTFFLAHMMLAFTDARRRESAKAAKHLEIAQRCCNEQDMFALLPQEDRSFDLIAYQSVVRCRSVPSRPLGSSDVDKVTQCPERLHEQEMDLLVLRDLILQRVPGPFEFVDGEMTNPCIRSCLRWCIHELKDMSSVPSIWKNVNRRSDFSMYAEVVATFTYLWDRCQNPRSQLDDSLTLWIMDTKSRMGISITHLLMFLCCMANSSSVIQWTRSKSGDELIANLQHRFELHMNLGDTDLATSFLDTFNPHNYFDQESLERRACFGPWSIERVDFHNASRSYFMDVLRKVLMVILPDEQCEEECLTPRQSPSNPGFRTLTSPLESDSFRRMRDGLQDSMQSISSLALNTGAVSGPMQLVNQVSEALRRPSTSGESEWSSTSSRSQDNSVSSSIRELLGNSEVLAYLRISFVH